MQNPTDFNGAPPCGQTPTRVQTACRIRSLVQCFSPTSSCKGNSAGSHLVILHQMATSLENYVSVLLGRHLTHLQATLQSFWFAGAGDFQLLWSNVKWKGFYNFQIWLPFKSHTSIPGNARKTEDRRSKKRHVSLQSMFCQVVKKSEEKKNGINKSKDFKIKFAFSL